VALVSTLAVAVPLAGLIASVTPQSAGAAISIYAGTAGGGPLNIVSGPDGALWFTNGSKNSIGRITTSGTVTNFTDPSISIPSDIASGPDGALWFTQQGNNTIGRITTSGTVTTFADPSINAPGGITSGPDGALWFTNFLGYSIGRITTSGTVTNFTGPGISQPAYITSGPDGALWFTNASNDSIGRITTSGTVTNYSDPSIDYPFGITVGPDGALWFDNYLGNSIGRITTSGTVTNFTDPSITGTHGITTGPGGLWFPIFAGGAGNSIGRITTSGTVTNYTAPGVLAPEGITLGPDGALWFTMFGKNKIGRLGPPGKGDSCSGGRSCLAAVAVVASVSSPSESVVVTGKPDSPSGRVELEFKKPGSLTCPSVRATKFPVAELTNKRFSKKTKLRVTVTLRQIASTGLARVCYHAPKPFKSQSPSTSGPGGGTGVLLACTATKNVAPCVLSSKPVKTSIVVVLYVPGGDPTFVVSWARQDATSYATGPAVGTVGTPFKSGFAVSGMIKPVRWTMTGNSARPPGLRFNAGTGQFSGAPTAQAGGHSSKV
jgi:virginiamycin B lyase